MLPESLRFTYKAYRALPSLASVTSKLLYLSPLLCLLISAMLNLEHSLLAVLNFIHVLLILYSFPFLLSDELWFHILQEACLDHHHPAQIALGLPFLCCHCTLVFAFNVH